MIKQYFVDEKKYATWDEAMEAMQDGETHDFVIAGDTSEEDTNDDLIHITASGRIYRTKRNEAEGLTTEKVLQGHLNQLRSKDNAQKED